MDNCKVCTKCKTEKSYGDFTRHKLANDGLHTQCKLCRNQAKAEWSLKNKAHVAKYNAQWSFENKDHIAKLRAGNRDRENELARGRYSVDREKCLEKNRIKYQKNIVARRAYSANFSKTHPWLKAFDTSLKKARSLGLVPAWADHDAMKGIYKRKYEMELLLGINLHVDHIIPLINKSVSGLHCESNLQILTASGNARKNNRFIL